MIESIKEIKKEELSKTLDSIDDTIKSISIQELQDYLLIKIIDLHLDIGKTADSNIANHTSNRLAEFLKEKMKGLKLMQIDDVCNRIGTGELGKVYNVNLVSLCSFFKEWNQQRQNSNKHLATSKLTSNKDCLQVYRLRLRRLSRQSQTTPKRWLILRLH